MSQYQVEYNILVNTNNAPQALMAFEQAVAPLAATARILQSVSTSVTAFNKAVKNLQNKPINIKVNIANGVEAKLDRLLKKIQQVKQAANGAATLGLNTAARTTNSRTTNNRVVSTPASRGTFRSTAGLQYQVLGPTPLTSDGGAAIGFLKGMGIAYGIAGAGQLVSRIVKDAVEYNNTIQTAKNILYSHDTRPNFQSRFTEMEGIIRQVGIETKFTAPEVADAARFLAMAGLKIEEINQAIRPIADIALIGDTGIGETADVVTNIMTAYNKPASQMRDIADILTMTFTKSNTTLMEMAEAFKYSAAILSAGNVRFEESAAAIGILGDAGIKGSQAGTTMRTIMANIVNPTKKQRAAWASLGVDPSGKTPYQVFEELSKKDLEVANFYQLFHKTAAQGAVALTDHVAKWKEIIVENAMSQGLSAKLADEKKNTLQGLWAQVTSIFTEDGMVAFSGIQSQIRQMLKGTIEYLQKPEVQEKFKSFANDMIGFVKTLKNSFAQIMGYFEKFGTIIKAYFKFQLMVWPIVQLVKALKSLWVTLKLLTRLPWMSQGIFGGLAATGIGVSAIPGAGVVANPSLATSRSFTTRNLKYDKLFTFNTKTRSLWSPLDKTSMFLSGGQIPATSANYAFLGRQAITAQYGPKLPNVYPQSTQDFNRHYNEIEQKYRNFKKIPQTAALTAQDRSLINRLYDFRLGKLAEAQRGVEGHNSRWDRLAQREANQIRNQRRLAATSSAVLGVGGGLLMGYASDWSPTSILGGGLMAATSLATIGGPAGWIGAGAVAALSAAWAFGKTAAAASEAQESMIRYGKTLKSTNGILIDSADKISVAFDILRNPNLTQEERQSKIEDLFDARLGRSAKPNFEATDVTGGQVFQDLQNNYDTARWRWTLTSGAIFTPAAASAASEISSFYKNGGFDWPFQVKTHRYLFYRSDDVNYNDPLTDKMYRLQDPNGSATVSDVFAFAAQAIALAAERQDFKKIEGQWQNLMSKDFYSGRFLDVYGTDKANWLNEYGKEAFLKHVDPSMMPGGSWFNTASTDDLTHPSIQNLVSSGFYQGFLYQIVKKEFEDARLAVLDAYEAKVNSGITDFSEEEALNIWTAADPFNMGVWFKNMVDGLPTFMLDAWDPVSGAIGSTKAVENALDFINQFNRLFPHLPPELQLALSTLNNKVNMFSTVLNSLAYDTTGMSLPVGNNGGAVNAGGYSWTKNLDGTYSTTYGDLKTKKDVKRTVTADTLLKMMAQDKGGKKKKDLNDVDTDDSNNSGGSGRGGSNDGYKNQYKGTAAAPKQLIINMDSLMNVEKIDLSKKDNSEAIASVKEQMAQALLDVVADFSHSSGVLG